MDQMLKMQAVAKKMEKMLETSLQQLKIEQKLRRDTLGKCSTMEERIKNLEIQLSQNEENFGKALNDRDEKIINLEATTEFLREALVKKDEEICKKEGIIKKLRTRINLFSRESDGICLDTVSNFEKRLSELIQGGKSKGGEECPSNHLPTNYEKTGPSEAALPPPPSPPPLPLESSLPSAIEITPLVRKEKCEEVELGTRIDIIEQIKTEDKADYENNDEILIPGVAETETQDNWDESDSMMQAVDPLENRYVEVEEHQIKIEPTEEDEIESLRNIKHKTRCKVCDSVFANKQRLVEHEKLTGHFLKFGCQHCDKRFKQKIQVKRHEAQVHSQEMPYQCNRCDRKFKSEFSWKRHQDNDEIHRRLENYTPFLSCHICGKQFERRRKWCLDQHLLTHDNSNKFPCQICGKYFRSNSYLTSHRKACSGIKEEECAFCGKKFSKKTVLANHERLHTGEKPYHCRVCGERFRTHHNYSVHGKNAHGALSASHFNLIQDETEKK